MPPLEPAAKKKRFGFRRILKYLFLLSLLCALTLKLAGGTLAIVHTQTVVTSAGAKGRIYGNRLVLGLSSRQLAPPLLAAKPGQALKVTPAQAKACPLPKTVDVVTGLYAGKLVKNLVVANDCYYGGWKPSSAVSFGSVPADSPQAAAQAPAPPRITFRKKP